MRPLNPPPGTARGTTQRPAGAGPSVPNPAHDPAPSRLSYRYQRWMLTPGIRFALRAGLPFVLVFALASAFMANETRRDALIAFATDIRTSIEERPEFMVNLMAIDGAGPNVSEDIREVVPIDFPVSSFDLDLALIRESIVGLDPVLDASVRIRPGGILQVQVTERVPAVVWRSYAGLAMLDRTGAHVDILARRALRPDLPLIAGEGADRAVGEALAIFAAAGPLRNRLRGLKRIGERRWDVVLDRDQRIALPAENPVPALERVIALAEAQDLLARDLTVIDMRIRERPTIRLSQNAANQRLQNKKTNGSGQ
jgi:cell division protein FtsQ